uniref:Uncharacterized protein n=1 Tax=Nelumbo nucifera TaxID=4432 RepID=A0A822ZFF8_NELNU|nr:TPA_asm: hypothetical protein HUJ06_014671 [Nelumbo nucifera]
MSTLMPFVLSLKTACLEAQDR